MPNADQQTLTDAQLEALYRVVSKERIGTYIVAAGHDVQRAARLYVWNAMVGEAFHVPIQAVEVALRNRVNDALIARFGVTWWDHNEFRSAIDQDREADLALVKRRIENRGLQLSNGQVVAGLSFGFWVGMLQRRYNPTIWSKHLRTAFPHFPADRSLKSLGGEVSKVVTLRNRISHHEPLIKRDISDDYKRVLTMIEWMCPTKLEWIKPHCRVPAIMRLKP